MTVTAAVLKCLHTKALLRALRMTRVRNSSMVRLINSICASRGLDVADITDEIMEDARCTVDADLLGCPCEAHVQSSVTVEELKLELAKRPHVPNKREAAALRRAKQLRNAQKGRRDRR